MKPFTLQIFYPDGKMNGVRVAELTNNMIQAICIPRNKVETALERKEISRAGLYFLIESKKDYEQEIYVGESENCKERIQRHNREKEFWDHVVVIVMNNEICQFTKTDAKFLKKLSFDTILENNMYYSNQNTPSKFPVREEKELDLLSFFEIIKLLVKILGYKFLEMVE